MTWPPWGVTLREWLEGCGVLWPGDLDSRGPPRRRVRWQGDLESVGAPRQGSATERHNRRVRAHELLRRELAAGTYLIGGSDGDPTAPFEPFSMAPEEYRHLRFPSLSEAAHRSGKRWYGVRVMRVDASSPAEPRRPRQDVIVSELTAAVAQFQRAHPDAGYWDIVRGVAAAENVTQRAVREVMPGRSERPKPGRRKIVP